MLNYGFSKCSFYTDENPEKLPQIEVRKGTKPTTEIKYENEEYEIINLNSAETVLANGSASFPEVFLLICGPLEDVKQDIENRTFALPEMEKKKSREREYIEWSNVNVSTVNGDINYDEYFRLAD